MADVCLCVDSNVGVDDINARCISCKGRKDKRERVGRALPITGGVVSGEPVFVARYVVTPFLPTAGRLEMSKHLKPGFRCCCDQCFDITVITVMIVALSAGVILILVKIKII